MRVLRTWVCDAAIGQYRIYSNVLKVIINVSDHIFLIIIKPSAVLVGTVVLQVQKEWIQFVNTFFFALFQVF